MNLIFPLLILGIIIVYLYKDFSQDKGFHTKAKILHAIVLTILSFLYLGSLSEIISLLPGPAAAADVYKGAGILSDEMMYGIGLLDSILGLIALLQLGKMLRRDNKARKTFIKLLPFLGALLIPFFYVGFIEDGVEPGLFEWLIFGIGALVIMGVFIGCAFLYRSKMMVDFFDRSLTNGSQSMEDLISEIGEDKENETN